MFYTKLSAMPYAQAKVAVINSSKKNPQSALVSYSTIVAHIIEGSYLIVNGLYGQTTRRHLGAYAKEYGNADYSTVKRCYQENLAYNIKHKVFISRETGRLSYNGI